jgi:DNA polymerase V
MNHLNTHTTCRVLDIGIGSISLKLLPTSVQGGFPSPAEDFAFTPVNLATRIAPRPATTFVMRVCGDSMKDAGIPDGCLISVDRSVRPKNGDVVVAAIDGDYTVKQLCIKDGHYALKPANDNYPTFELKEGQTLEIWGVVMAAVTELHRP